MPLTFTYKAQSAKWGVVYELAKTTGKTVYLISASEPCTPLDASSWFIANVAAIGSNYPSASGWLPCRTIAVDPADQTRMLFVAECNYDNTNEIVENPLAADVSFEYDDESYEESYFVDETSEDDEGPKYAKHTNGVPFSENPKRDSSILVITVTKNVAASTTIGAYSGVRRKVNAADVTIDGEVYGPRTVRVAKLSLSKLQTMNGVDYKTLTTTLKVKGDTWDQKFESLGLVEIADDVDWPITDPDGHPITEPWPLDADGAAKTNRSDPGEEITLRPYGTSTTIGDLC